jgi:hypothetical protein
MAVSNSTTTPLNVRFVRSSLPAKAPCSQAHDACSGLDKLWTEVCVKLRSRCEYGENGRLQRATGYLWYIDAGCSGDQIL